MTVATRTNRRGVYVPRLTFQGPLYEQLFLPFMEGRFGDLATEYLVEGPTGTGKSVQIAALIHYAARAFPGANILVLRKVKADLSGSFMQMWEDEILDWEDPFDRWMLTNGDMRSIPAHSSRQYYKYPPQMTNMNGRRVKLQSRIWCRGMDQWARVKSMAYDIIWPMEMTEFEEEDIEGLMTRRRARSVGGVEIPFGKRMLIGDANPEYPQHWCNQRALDGYSERIRTTLKDNPGYYDRKAMRYSPAGEDYLQGLEDQIRDPARRARYIRGEWSAASGQILEFEEPRHTFDGRVIGQRGKPWEIVMNRTHPVLGDRVELRGFGASYDWGDVHAGTLQVWGIDDAGRQYLVEEVYHSKKTATWWAEWAVRLWQKYDLQFIVCDNAAKDSIHLFNVRLQEEGGNHARIAVPCDKRSGNREASNMEVLRDLFSNQRDGAPAVYLKKNALAHAPDPAVKVQCLQEEIPQFLYAEFDPGRHKGRAEDKPDRKCVDDGLDACCYFRVHMLGGRKVNRKFAPGDGGYNPHELMRDHYWDE